MHGAEPTVHHGLAGPNRHFPEGKVEPFGSQCLLDEVIVADRGATGCDQDVALELSRKADGGCRFAETVGSNTKVGRLAAFMLGQGHRGKAVRIDDFSWARIGSGHDQFVTGGKHGDAWPSM